jgi:hypothetical protein
VSEMNRVECAAKQTNPLHMGILDLRLAIGD